MAKQVRIRLATAPDLIKRTHLDCNLLFASAFTDCGNWFNSYDKYNSDVYNKTASTVQIIRQVTNPDTGAVTDKYENAKSVYVLSKELSLYITELLTVIINECISLINSMTEPNIPAGGIELVRFMQQKLSASTEPSMLLGMLSIYNPNCTYLKLAGIYQHVSSALRNCNYTSSSSDKGIRGVLVDIIDAFFVVVLRNSIIRKISDSRSITTIDSFNAEIASYIADLDTNVVKRMGHVIISVKTKCACELAKQKAMAESKQAAKPKQQSSSEHVDGCIQDKPAKPPRASTSSGRRRKSTPISQMVHASPYLSNTPADESGNVSE